MNRNEYYFKRKVVAPDMNGLFDKFEGEIKNVMINLWRQSFGISNYESGGGLIRPDDFSGRTLTIPYDTYARANGKFVYIPAGTTTTIPESYWDDVSTSEEKSLRLMIKHQYSQADPQIDGYGNTVYFSKTDSYLITIVEGPKNAVGAKYTYPTHPRNGDCSLCVIIIGYVGANKAIKYVSLYPNQGGVYDKAQDRIEGLGIQYPDFYGSQMCVMSFYLPSKPKLIPGVLGYVAARTLTHPWGIGVKCAYNLTIYANEGGKYTHGPLGAPVSYAFTGTGAKFGSIEDFYGIWIQDFPSQGKFEIKCRDIPEHFWGAFCDVFVTKVH